MAIGMAQHQCNDIVCTTIEVMLNQGL